MIMMQTPSTNSPRMIRYPPPKPTTRRSSSRMWSRRSSGREIEIALPIIRNSRRSDRFFLHKADTICRKESVRKCAKAANIQVRSGCTLDFLCLLVFAVTREVHCWSFLEIVWGALSKKGLAGEDWNGGEIRSRLTIMRDFETGLALMPTTSRHLLPIRQMKVEN